MMQIDPSSPPAGIPPLVWLFIFLIGGPTGAALIMSKTAARLPGIFGALGRWWQSREPRLSDQVTRAEIERLVADYQRLAAARADDREMYSTELAAVKDEVAAVREEMRRVWSQFWAALAHMRILTDIIRRLDPTHEIPPVPEVLKEYL